MLSSKYLAIWIISIFLGLAASEEDEESAYCKNGILSNREVTMKLREINRSRRRIAAGKQENGWRYQPDDVPSENLYLPPAKNMMEMGYDCSLEKEASRILAKMECSDVISEQQEPTRGFAFYGSLYSSGDALQVQLSMIFSNRFTEPGRYTEDDKDLEGYANMMRGTASKVGCANRSCTEWSSWGNLYMELCITDQSKLENGEQIYEIGTKDSCDCDTPLTCEDSLCYNAVFPGSDAEQSSRCTSIEIDDTIRMHMQDTHNYRRSLLALGQVVNKQGQTLPTATNINYLTWDCALEREAHDFLRSCPTEGYQRPDDDSPAQNFYRGTITANEPTYRDMNKKTVTEWWKQVRKVEGLDGNAYFRQKHNSSAIKSYTLMGWASSKQMGCSIAKCGNDWVEACRYYPPGNQVEGQMYKPGRTCSECKKLGTGPCDAELGLCVPKE